MQYGLGVRTRALSFTTILSVIGGVLLVLALWVAVTWGAGLSATPIRPLHSQHVQLSGSTARIVPDPLGHVGGS